MHGVGVRTRIVKEPQGSLSPAKRFVFCLITIGLPVLLLGALETGLRVFHYGPDLSLFRDGDLDGKRIYIQNQAVKGRYFSHVAFNPTASPDIFLASKPPGTFRIFCLGGSTTVGYPYWYNAAFSTFLRDRLKAIFPRKHIEIVNVGMTATNSYTVLDMAQDLVDYAPDLFIVYDGHNEFYGALGVASNETVARARWLTLTYLKLLRFRTFLLMRSVYESLAGAFHQAPPPEPGNTMMEKLAKGQFIPYRSSLYGDAYDVFKANMEDLKDICRRHGIPLILSSQASDLRAQPPFVSDSLERLPQAVKARFDSVFSLGQSLRESGHLESAIAAFRSCIAIDSLHAGAHYRLAQCLDTTGNKDEAKVEYIEARDYDLLRFRMSSDFNNLVREECKEPGVMFADIEQVFGDHSPDGIIGNELIVEHLHPNSRGYFLMAKEYARILRSHQFIAGAADWAACDTISDDVLWRNRNVTPIDEVIARRRTEILTSGWPFRAGIPLVDAVAPDDTLGHIAEQVTRARWTWDRAHSEAADYYLSRGEVDKAIKEYKTMINMIPVGVAIHLKLARLFLDKKDYESTRLELLASLNVEKTILACRALGDIYLNENQPREATRYYEQTLTFDQTPRERVENGYLLALAYSRGNMREKATNQLLQVLNIKPDYQPAVKLLSEINAAPQHH